MSFIFPLSASLKSTQNSLAQVCLEISSNILKPIIKASSLFTELASRFEGFGKAIKKEEAPDKRSLAGFEQKINEELARWGVSFNFSIESPKEDDIVKGLIRHSITDSELQEAMDPSSFWHGFQRHLIFTIIRLAASYVPPRPAPRKKEFAPEFDLLLFEEPEAFLHPPQQEVLDSSLRELAKQSDRQVPIATHSPLFVSYNTDDIVDLIRVAKPETKTEINQISREELSKTFEENQELIREALGIMASTGEEDLELEALRHFLWLNPERSSMFFSDFVLIVEGLSEQILITYLIKMNQLKVPDRGVFVLDAVGKYEIPRFMNLLGALNIDHVVLHDLDSTKKYDALNELIQQSVNPHTLGIEILDKNLEDILAFTVPADRWKKASAVLLAVKNGRIDPEKLAAFIKRVNRLFEQSQEPAHPRLCAS